MSLIIGREFLGPGRINKEGSSSPAKEQDFTRSIRPSLCDDKVNLITRDEAHGHGVLGERLFKCAVMRQAIAQQKRTCK